MVTYRHLRFVNKQEHYRNILMF